MKEQPGVQDSFLSALSKYILIRVLSSSSLPHKTGSTCCVTLSNNTCVSWEVQNHTGRTYVVNCSPYQHHHPSENRINSRECELPQCSSGFHMLSDEGQEGTQSYPFQSGFWTCYGTETALVVLVDNLRGNRDAVFFPVGPLLALSGILISSLTRSFWICLVGVGVGVRS